MQRSWHRSCAPTKGCLTQADDSIPNNITSNIHAWLLTSDSWSLPPDVPGQTDEPTISRISPVFCSLFVHGTRRKGAGTLLPPAVLLYLFQRPSGISGLAGRISHWENRLCAYQLVVTNQVFESASVEIMMITSVYLFFCI